MDNMNWDGFRYFLAAAEAGSLSAAAKLLGSKQPTVGRHIDALEASLGVKLFQRSVKGLSLTQEGQFVYEQSKAIHHTVVKIRRMSEADQQDISGTVRLSLPEGLAHAVLIPSLDAFYQRYPHVHLDINISAATANLTRGDADIAIRLFRPREKDLVIKFLGHMAMAVYASSAYQKNFGLPETISELKQHRIIAYGRQQSSLAENQWLLEQVGEIRCVMHSDSTMARINATRAGIGISIQPVSMARQYADLVPVFSTTDLTPHDVWLVYHQDLRNTPRIRVVNEFISEQLSAFLQA